MNWWAIGNALGQMCQKQHFFIAFAIVQGAEFVWDFSFINKYKKIKNKNLSLSDQYFNPMLFSFSVQRPIMT